MRSIRIAEWILELSMTRERAEAVAGDLRETERGALWFWRSVIATMIASVWSDVRSAGWLLTGSAVLGLITAFAAESIILWVSLQRSQAFAHRMNGVTDALVGLFVGRWVAQRCRGHELGAWVALEMVSLLIAVSIAFALFAHGNPNLYIHYSPLPSVLALAGAISARLRPRLMVRHA